LLVPITTKLIVMIVTVGDAKYHLETPALKGEGRLSRDLRLRS